jgi:integrase
MASIFKKDQRKGAPWYIDYFDENGQRHRVKGCSDRGATDQIARKLESEVELRRRGVTDARVDARVAHSARPLSDHLEAFHAHLIAKDSTTKHAVLTLERARRVVALVKGATLAVVVPPKKITTAERETFAEKVGGFVKAARLIDLTGDRVQSALATLRDSGMSLQSVNHHRAAIRGFSRWAWRAGRTVDDALAGVTGLNVKEDRRHDRRTLAIGELRLLIYTAHRGPKYREMTGPTRALCYRLAVATGLRFSEIKSITPESFDLAGRSPNVTVTAGYTKNGEPANLPLPIDLTDDLAGFVASIPRGVPVFPLPDRGATMLRLDLEAAGIPYRDDAGQVFDFHSLRCQCATLADQAGVSPRVVQRMMRHSTLELTGRYTRPRVADLESATDSLPSLAPRAVTPVILEATGTDCNPTATASATIEDAYASKPLLFIGDTSNEQRYHNPRVGGSNPSAATCDPSCLCPTLPRGSGSRPDGSWSRKTGSGSRFSLDNRNQESGGVERSQDPSSPFSLLNQSQTKPVRAPSLQ